MSDSSAQPRRRWLLKYVLIIGAAALAFVGVLTWYVTTDSFQAMVRRRLVAELERVTGGRVELGGFHTIPFRFQIDVRDLTIHGREQPTDIPYAHVDRLIAQAKLISVLGAEFGFHSLQLDHPVFHIITYPDGTTNQPAPKGGSVDARTQLQHLFSFSIGQLQVRKGELLWNDQKIPLDFAANDVSVQMNYSLLHRRYDGSLLVGKIDTAFDGYRPVAWTGEAHFELTEDSLVVNSLKAVSGRSHLEASGRMVDFREPSAVGEYNITLDIAEVGATARLPEMRHGTLQIAGGGSWSRTVFSTNGTLQGKDLDWRNASLRLQAPSLTSQFTVNPQRLWLSDLTAKLFGGEITGDAQVLNWKKPLLAGNSSRNNEQRGIVRLRVKDLSAEEIALALSSSARPLQRLNLAGAASGTLETHWIGSPRKAETEIALDVVAPDLVRAGQLPLNAHARATYRNPAEELEFAEFNASTRATQLRVSGTLSKTAALKVSVATSNFGEWEDVLAALGYQDVFPFTMRGHASFSGTAIGKLSDVDFTGKLQSQNFMVVIPASATAARREMRWDSLAADFELSPHVLAVRNGTLHHGSTLVQFDVNAGLEQRQFTESSPFRLNLQMHDADAAEVLSTAGYQYPVTGKVNLSLHASGTRASPSGQGFLQLSNGTIRGEPVQQAESKFTFNRQQVSLQDIHLASGDGQVTGTGSYDFASRAFLFNLDGCNFDLARFPSVQASRVAVKGRMDFVAQGSGTPQQPVVHSQIHLRDLTFDNELAGDYTLDAVTKGPDLQISGRSQFTDKELTVEGNVHLQGDWPAKIDFRFNRLDVDPLLSDYLKGRVTGHSAVTGDLHLQGPLRTPRELQVSGNLSDVFAELEHVQLRNNGTIRFSAFEYMLNIQRFRLIGEGTDLEIGGSLQLAGEQALNLNAEGHADLRLIHSFNPDFSSSGTVAVNLMASGTLPHPIIQGRLQITDGMIQYSDLPSALSDLNGSLVFNENRLQIETLTAHVGGGLVSFGGYATLYNRQVNFDVSLQAQDVRLRYPQGISSMTTADLRWAGTPGGSTLSGNATITKLAITPGFDFSAYLQQSSQASALPPTNPVLSNIRLDVHITTTPQLQMQTAALSLSGDADLHLRGTAAKPVLLGRVDILEGQIAFNGTKYRLERGGITFTNPVTTTPVLDLRASTRMREYDITVNLNGEFDKLNLSYHSEPPLPTADIISLLAPVGSTQEQFGQLQQQTGPSPFVQQASSAVLAEALNSALSNRSQRLFGISHIKIDPQGLNTETTPIQTSPLPAVTIEQPVRENITLSYTTNLAQTSQQIIQGEYSITSNVSIVGLRDYNGVVSFEVRLRRRKK
jgi:translocation and assembly module TamB